MAFKCKICKSVFRSKGMLTKHVKIHNLTMEDYAVKYDMAMLPSKSKIGKTETVKQKNKHEALRREEPNEVILTPVPEFAPLAITLEDVANGKVISQSSVDEIRDRLKIAMVIQAKEQLEKVIQLTRTLDKLQMKYQDKIFEYMERHDDAESAVTYLPMMIETITTCLQNSYSIINQVVGNDKIMNFQMIQNNNITDSTFQIGTPVTGSIVADLEDPISRERVRSAVGSILKSLSAEGLNPEDLN